jgi:ribokinase
VGSGLPVGSKDDLAAAASSLLASGVGAVILTLGERGALLAQEGAHTYFPAFSMEQVVDTTAAGDAFVGGLASAVAEGKSLAEAVPWGNATGALAITKAGAQPSLPTRRQVEDLLSKARGDLLQGVRL